MGIKGWLAIGGLVLTGLAGLLKMKQKEDEHKEKVRMMIREVDGGDEKTEETETEPASVETMSDDVEKAFRDMGLDEEADAYAGAMDGIHAIKQATSVLQKANAMLNGEDEESKKTEERIIEQLNAYRKERDKTTWPEDVKKAIEMKNFIQLENLFDYKYAGGPWQPSPASVFGDAYRDGVITDEFYSEAARYFGKLWNYSGD